MAPQIVKLQSLSNGRCGVASLALFASIELRKTLKTAKYPGDTDQATMGDNRRKAF
jgi:hypothetical protein